MIPDSELQAIRERCRKAPAGPWTVDGPIYSDNDGPPSYAIDSANGGLVATVNRYPKCDECPSCGGDPAAVADFIAHARFDVAALLTDHTTLRAAIRKHRDQRGDDRCFLDDEELYAALPEGYTPPAREVAVELALCEKFIRCRRNPKTEYVSPQREIDRLRAELASLRTTASAAVRELTDGRPLSFAERQAVAGGLQLAIDSAGEMEKTDSPQHSGD